MKIIFLIISSDDIGVYGIFKKVIIEYCEEVKKNHDFEYFFIEFKNELQEDIVVTNNHIYMRGTESIIPGIIKKTFKSIDWINEHYEYDFLVRTNLSSFWNIPYLYTLACHWDKTKFAGGIVIFDSFITGTGIIFSKDVARILITKEMDIPMYDDVLISQHLKTITEITRIDENKLVYLIDDEKSIIPNDLDSILYFRVKGSGNRDYDAIMFETLKKKIYHL